MGGHFNFKSPLSWRVTAVSDFTVILHDDLLRECGNMPPNQIQYSEKYFDDVYEYRHVVLPSDIAALLPKGRLLSENEWRGIGVQQSRGWVHYAIHKPEPHIMLFRYWQAEVTVL
ncbi:hypothetical protein WJX82_005775 [Trebouxia sp. C0006]